MTRFRPCIDLHDGRVKQIVGGSLSDTQQLMTNFISEHSSAWYAELYRRDSLEGGHLIKLGPGNDEAARLALAAWPGGLQVGGGIDQGNAAEWLELGASKVIVTSSLFVDGKFSFEKLSALSKSVGSDRLVVDLSCRKVGEQYHVATNRWQTVTETTIDAVTLEKIAKHCSEFLIHAADVEGLQGGMDEQLIRLLAAYSTIPCTYAGGARSLQDLKNISEISGGRLDLTIGSALDIFGGSGIRYEDCVRFNASE